ncbi:hypothetical protein [Escherichia coli]|uniref:hypothetical protein n=1 Tax=Escherichia coli TaxID=562 RepID=UPI0021D33CB1|nr:hypothetical protein [Escherichia coli]MCU6294867.1 hypothetical protein [Escherichia coli]
MTKRIVLLNESSTTQLLNAVHYDIETSVNLISTVVLLDTGKVANDKAIAGILTDLKPGSSTPITLNDKVFNVLITE